MKVQRSILLLIVSTLIGPAFLTDRIDVVEHIDEDVENNNETSAASTNNANTTNWSSAPTAEDMQRIMTPVIITSPQADKNKNFSASPMLDSVYNPGYHQYNPGKHKSPQSSGEYSSKEQEDRYKKPQYSQPLPPDLFLAQQYLKSQQQREHEDYSSRNNNKHFYPKPVIPQAKSNGYHNYNSESISYKPLKFDTDYPSTSFTSDKGTEEDKKKEVPFQFSLPTPMKGNTHPYPYHHPYSSGEKELEPPSKISSTVPKGLSSGNGWADGYKTALNHQEGEKTSMWKKVLNMLAAFIPLGLFLAALPPNVLTINTTTPDLPSRQRSVDQEDSDKVDIMSFPILDLLDKYGIDSLDDPECENRIFCEMSRLGKEPTGNIVQKAFWHLAQDTSDKTAESLGMKELFKAVRTDACNIYRCKEVKDKSMALPSTKQKLKEEKEQLSDI